VRGRLHFVLDPNKFDRYGRWEMKIVSRSRKPLLGLYGYNFVANFIGNLIIALLNLFSPIEELRDWRSFVLNEGILLVAVFIPLVVVLVIGLQAWIQRPIQRAVAQGRNNRKIDPQTLENGRRRLLHLPFILSGLNILTWIVVTALFIPFLTNLRDWSALFGLYVLFRGCMIALISGFTSFFLVDAYSRNRLIPHFFPDGKLSETPVRIKISILRRIRILFGAGTNAPMLLLVGTIGFGVWQRANPTVNNADFGREILIFAVVVWMIFVGISLSLNYLVGKSILQPIRDMLRVVRQVHKGNYQHRVPVVTNDELGILGDGMNEMTEGLRERERMRHSLILAKEIQQTLLPSSDPRLPGLDIAGHSIYCEGTGGDYFDYLLPEDPTDRRIGIVVGDVSGHGISSALLMATSRGFLRQRAALPGSIGAIVTDVNRQLIGDVADSCSFMTLFYLQIDLDTRALKWVRAGHDPGLIYDPDNDDFVALDGRGAALGLNPDAIYREYRRSDLKPNQIIVLGTDGIWESFSPAGEMFGKKRLERAIAHYRASSARDIMLAILSELEDFQQGRPAEDDITLIVIKVLEESIHH